MGRVVLARHAQTDYNLLGRVQGSGNKPGITKEGYAQIGRMKLFLESFARIERIISSDLKRAVQTVQILRSMEHVHHVELSEGLREISRGNYEGLAYSGKEWAAFSKRLAFGEGIYEEQGGSESHRSARNRIVRVMEEILHEDSGNILVISHGEAIRLYISYLERMSISQYLMGIHAIPRIANCCCISIENAGEAPRWKIVYEGEK